MEQKAKRIGKLNIIDLLAILLIAAVLVLAAWKFIGRNGDSIDYERRSVMDMEVSSLKKKFKDKKFAAGCSRDVIREGAENLGWTLEELMEKSNVSEVSRRITQDIIPRYKEYLMKDIVASYETIGKEIKQFFEDTKASNREVLQTSAKSADEIRASYEKSKKELEEVQAYREQLTLAINQLKANTDERVEQLCNALNEMMKNA